MSHFGGSCRTNYFVNDFFGKKETHTQKKHPQSRMTLMLIARHLIWQSVWMSQHRPRRLIDGWCLKNAAREHHGEERSATKQITSRVCELFFLLRKVSVGLKMCFKRDLQHRHWGTEWLTPFIDLNIRRKSACEHQTKAHSLIHLDSNVLYHQNTDSNRRRRGFSSDDVTEAVHIWYRRLSRGIWSQVDSFTPGGSHVASTCVSVSSDHSWWLLTSLLFL